LKKIFIIKKIGKIQYEFYRFFLFPFSPAGGGRGWRKIKNRAQVTKPYANKKMFFDVLNFTEKKTV